jgi:hypothetical protein
MRPQARRFAENWLDEHASEASTENASAKVMTDELIGDGEARGINAEDFNDDNGHLLEMELEAIGRGAR